MAPAKRTTTLVLASFTRSSVMELAGPRAFARGLSYHAEARVELQPVKQGRVRALVRGTMPYEVELWEDRGEPAWSCSCPVGDDGEFCKHCVAVALELVGDAQPPNRSGARTLDDGPDLRAHLRGLESEELVDLVVEQAERDWRLRERLTAQAAAKAGKGIDVAKWRRRVDAVFDTGSFVPYAEAEGWAQDVEEMLDALEELIEAGHADAVVTLAERAHRCADEAMQHVDDSDGCLGNISERVGDLHLRACEVAQPDAVELARRLVDLELSSELDAFHRAAARYAGVLGAPGIAEYRGLVEPRWRALSPRGDRFSTERFRLTEAMVGVALATGDPEALIAVKRKDLHTPDDYREVADSLAAAGRTDEAIEWAHKGLAAFPDRPWQTPPLRELLAALLHGRGDSQAAVELFWSAFESAPTLDAYRRLLQEAEPYGNVDEWRQRALRALRARVAELRPADDEAQRSLVRRTPASSLVEILLYEGEADAAWQTGSEYGCDPKLWLTLARAREKTHPLDAIPVYEREAVAQIATKKNAGYRRAVDYLARIRMLSQKADNPELFEQLISSVRTQHKLKRNLMALLDQKGW